MATMKLWMAFICLLRLLRLPIKWKWMLCLLPRSEYERKFTEKHLENENNEKWFDKMLKRNASDVVFALIFKKKIYPIYYYISLSSAQWLGVRAVVVFDTRDAGLSTVTEEATMSFLLWRIGSPMTEVCVCPLDPSVTGAVLEYTCLYNEISSYFCCNQITICVYLLVKYTLCGIRMRIASFRLIESLRCTKRWRVRDRYTVFAPSIIVKPKQ